MERKEAVDLLKELGNEHLVEPLMVVVEQKKPNSFQLIIKGNYNLVAIDTFLINRGFLFEQREDYLLIFKS